MRLYRYRDGHGVAITKDLAEIDYLRELGLNHTPDCPFSMEPLTRPRDKVWYDFPFSEDRWSDVEAGSTRRG